MPKNCNVILSNYIQMHIIYNIFSSAFLICLMILLTGFSNSESGDKIRTIDPSEAPDILIIMPDQMRGDMLSAVGHPVVKTPKMDELADGGALFRRAYSTVPSCIPARYAMLTGMSPQTSGVVGSTNTRVTRQTMPHIFQNAGYQTAFVGRTMHQLNTDEELGYERVIQGSVYPRRHDDYLRFLKDKLSLETTLGKILHEKGLPAMVEAIGVTYNHWQAEPWPLDDSWHPTSWIARESQQVVRDAPANQPLFLTASFYAPHPPLFPPSRYFDAYLNMDLPDVAFGTWVNRDLLSAAVYPPPPGSHGGSRVILEGEQLRRAQAGYFGLIEHLDHAITPLIDDFKRRSEQAGRPWVILITSEHGEMLGDHGYFRKCEPYEGSANIPFLIAASSNMGYQQGIYSSQPVGLEDVLPTLADIAEIDTPEVDGISLVPLMQGEDHQIRPWFHMEHAPTYSDEQAFHALTDGQYKYIWRPLNGTEQLFDLDADPKEESDLTSNPDLEDQVEKWRNRLVERLAPRPEGFSDGKRLIAGRPYKPIQAGKTP